MNLFPIKSLTCPTHHPSSVIPSAPSPPTTHSSITYCIRVNTSTPHLTHLPSFPSPLSFPCVLPHERVISSALLLITANLFKQPLKRSWHQLSRDGAGEKEECGIEDLEVTMKGSENRQRANGGTAEVFNTQIFILF